MFCTWIPLENSIRAFQNWSFATIAISTVGVKGKGNSKGKKQLLIANGKGEFDQDVLDFGNNFKTTYEQLFETYNGGQCDMVLIKKCGNNIQRRSIFESTIVHNLHKGY